IFLEALGLVLGKRGDISVLQNKSRKCVIEAEFDAKGLKLDTFFKENELDNDPQIILRREISAEGKSRSFLNDTPVALNVLKLLSERIIDIHSQHQTLLLNQSNFQLEIVDAFAGSLEVYKNYKADFFKLTKLQSSLKDLQEQELLAKKELDYFQFLFTELEEAEIKPGILKKLEEESLTLENAETIKSSLLNVANGINGETNSILQNLSQLRQTLQSISKFGSDYAQFYERLNSAHIELKELAVDAEDAESRVTFDQQKLNEVNSKLDKLNRLLKKHGVSSEDELLKTKEEIENKLTQFSSLETQIEKTIKEIKEIKGKCTSEANKLSGLRKNAVNSIEQSVKELLTDLSIPNANFKIDISSLTELTVTGFDKVQFLFSANKGTALNELHKVASGGELSRLMLSLKSLLATKKELPTIIFDEIDTGVSGDVADKIGIIMNRMGKSMQVITITHLPQIASKGNHHLFVYKKDDEERTSSFIKELNKDERVTEIAKMLSTGTPTQSALKNAKELLSVT
ncbi:MAG: recN, partial [Bacteroidetes bacterium]|nr:recN [Bacteroidota bacterium]